MGCVFESSLHDSARKEQERSMHVGMSASGAGVRPLSLERGRLRTTCSVKQSRYGRRRVRGWAAFLGKMSAIRVSVL